MFVAFSWVSVALANTCAGDLINPDVEHYSHEE